MIVSVASYLSKMHLVEDDFIWVANAPEPGNESQQCNDGQSNPEVPFWSLSFVVRLGGFDQSIEVGISRSSWWPFRANERSEIGSLKEKVS